MATYVIGDVQGCDFELVALLRALKFDRHRDCAWFVGDLVNRGPSSLAVLRRISGLGAAARVVLGNHDLHLLAIVYGGHSPRRGDTFDDLLAAPDILDLAAWLRSQPLLYDSADLGWLMVHAGVPPTWTLPELKERAAAAADCYQGPQGDAFFRSMYGDADADWRDDLAPLDAARCVVNYLTRMRLLATDGRLDFEHKGPLPAPAPLQPWFEVPRTTPLGRHIAFGHWAALQGCAGDRQDIAALDTGCVWGRSLTALCLETGVRTAVAAQ